MLKYINFAKKAFIFIAKWTGILFLISITLFLIAFFGVDLFIKPSNDRDWNLDQKILPVSEIKGDIVSIKNIRNFSYNSTTDYVPNYYDKDFDLNKIKRAWFMVEPLTVVPGSAHTLVSFEFEDNQFISISVEIRKEKGEKYNPFHGMFNKYELMYVIADERDVVKLRSNYRKDLVYLYPIKAEKEKVKKMFLEMINRASSLSKNPEFYNTITSTCTTNITDHIHKISPNKIPLFSFRILLPATVDVLAYKLGLIDTDLGLEDARKKYLINDRAMKYANDENFSVKIRE